MSKTCLVCVFIFQGINKSQKNRMVEAGKDLWKLSSPIPVLKQIHQKQACDCVQADLVSLQMRERYFGVSQQPVKSDSDRDPAMVTTRLKAIASRTASTQTCRCPDPWLW